MLLKSYLKSLNNLKKNNSYRSLKISNRLPNNIVRRNNKYLISFCCNDYFGLSHHSKIKKEAIKTIREYGVGSASSRYIVGNNSLYEKLEKKLAQYKNCEDAIVFSSGYLVAIGIIPALVDENDLVLFDRLSHSCLIDGVKLSRARFIRFQHNSISHCKDILQNNRSKYKKCLIITETVFSMDGDLGKVAELLDLANQFDCLLISDDAHGLEFNNISSPIYLQMGTLSKAFGTMGGYIAGEKFLIDYLRNFSKTAIYNTALPPSILASAIASLEIISSKKLLKKVLSNARLFCKLLKLPDPQSAIVVIVVGDNKKVLDIANKIEKNGYLISAIRPPTVEKGKARLRITFSANHRKSDIKQLAKLLDKEIFCRL
jgi:8-amino-7-oxononanoate synthase